MSDGQPPPHPLAALTTVSPSVPHPCTLSPHIHTPQTHFPPHVCVSCLQGQQAPGLVHAQVASLLLGGDNDSSSSSRVAVWQQEHSKHVWKKEGSVCVCVDRVDGSNTSCCGLQAHPPAGCCECAGLMLPPPDANLAHVPLRHTYPIPPCLFPPLLPLPTHHRTPSCRATLAPGPVHRHLSNCAHCLMT